MSKIEPVIETKYHVIAYNSSWGGYGDNASRDFITNEQEAVEYARKLPEHLIKDAQIWKVTTITVAPIRTRVMF